MGMLFYPLLYIMNYDYNNNPDINNYMNDFIFEHKSYDVGYEFILLNFKTYISSDFYTYWKFYLSIQIILLAMIYRNSILLFIALLNIVPLADIFYGTQIRYSLAALFLVIGLNIGFNIRKRYRLLFLFSAPFIHFGMILPMFLYYGRNVFLDI
ncbi:hypothetical protein [Photobacterium damselae]|uniref:hypothetical protein n=1 Tax=Photobacterium damselae TaxID=38293 RepID=UPI001F21F493|nr:hypothetical protein [Photobacterium damselae]UKA02545.1 hypothetical protein IHC89_04280 [Photobacterium damselae subsp. damselae]